MSRGPAAVRFEKPEASLRYGDEWRTPPELFDTLNAEFSFELDAACTTDNCLAPRGLCADEGVDARFAPWSPGPVWCNPPYSRVEPWLGRALVAARSTIVVLLIPADTSTGWWRRHVADRATQVRFIVGRLRFLSPRGERVETKRGGGGKTGPSAIVIFTPAGGPPSYSYIDRCGRPA